MRDETGNRSLGAARAAPLIVAAMSLVCLSTVRGLGGRAGEGDPMGMALLVGALVVANLATWRLYRRARTLEGAGGR